jgi:hypothetical protein
MFKWNLQYALMIFVFYVLNLFLYEEPYCEQFDEVKFGFHIN